MSRAQRNLVLKRLWNHVEIRYDLNEREGVNIFDQRTS